MTIEESLMVINTIRNVDVRTVYFVQFTVFVRQIYSKCLQYLFIVALLLVLMYIQGVTGGTGQTSGECSLGQTILI